MPSLPSAARVAAAILLSLSAAAPASPAQGNLPRARPRLAVIVCVDQLATWLVHDALPFLGKGGIREMAAEGVWFRHCEFPYAALMTGPGHATVSTGANPSRHGIIGNSWFDRTANKAVYCCEDPEARPVGSPSGPRSSPALLRAPTIGDQFKVHFGKAAKVVSIAWKDRSAILCAGRSGDAVVWMDAASGNWVTSSFYGEELPAWAVDLNRRRFLDGWFGRVWERAGPPEAYADLEDDRPFEPTDADGRRTLPRRIHGGSTSPASGFYGRMGVSPFANEAILETAFAAIESENLGQDGVPDLLFIGFSANDYVGHAYGPRSVEMRDMTIRTDQLLSRLVQRLDEAVGRDRYTLVLTADHAIPPAPESLQGTRIETGRNDAMLEAAMAANRALVAHLGEPPPGHSRWVLNRDGTSLFLDRDAIRKAGVPLDRAVEIAARAAEDLAFVEQAFPCQPLLEGRIAGDPIAQAVSLNIHRDRSGDVYVVSRPYWLPGTATSTHGTPYPYDQEVPLLVLGGDPSIAAHASSRLSPAHTASVLAFTFGIPRPPFATPWPPAP